VLEDDASLCAPSRLLATAAQRGVTYADIPPAYLAHLDAEALPACLSTLVVGGEVAPPHEVRRLAERVALFNVYGPTEATICTSLGRCDAAWSRSLLGQPIAGNTYELEPHEGLPPGEGELLIAGRGLALGYHRDEALTARRFVLRAGRRWYRTGDVVRRYADGEWEFRGRVDRQLKLRGQRVAPEQVEGALLRTGAVRAASVSLSGDGQRLLAQVEPYVAVSRGERAAWGAQLRETLRQQLPAGLVPDEVWLTDELPRGATGKLVHVHATASPRATVASEPPEDAPSAPALALLCGWMGGVLGRAALAPDEDFFDAGGTSLLALEVATRAEAAGSRVSAASIARGRTPRAVLAAHTSEPATLPSRAAQDHWLGRVTPLSRPSAGRLFATQVLVTGTTGTLGGALLPRLLDELGPAGRVHCLVRRPDALRDAALPPAVRAAALDPRVAVHVGDVAEEHLGLDAPRYAQLAEQLHAVIHLAARLSAAASLCELNAVNLEGTRRVLELCASGRPKALLHASTLSVFTDALPRPEHCMEADDLAITEALLTPYATSKWLAERLVRSADPHAHAATIVRLGLLTGTATDGLGAPHGHLARFLRGLARVGALPASCVAAAAELQLDITPLDHAADACLALLRHDRAAGVGGTYHVAAARPATLAELMAAMQAEGIPLRALPPEEFFTLAGEQRDPSGDARPHGSLARARRARHAFQSPGPRPLRRHGCTLLAREHHPRAGCVLELAAHAAARPRAPAPLRSGGARMKRGVGMVLGKFYPPHRGHVYLCEFALAHVERLHIVVGTLARETIPGAVRHALVQELVPGATVHHLTDENPQDPSEHPEFWRIWRESLLRILPEPVDVVFASEPYGARLASELGARFVPADPARAILPIRATAVRQDPLAAWDDLPRAVRPLLREARVPHGARVHRQDHAGGEPGARPPDGLGARVRPHPPRAARGPARARGLRAHRSRASWPPSSRSRATRTAC
jgi:thioester reductase-like protein